MPESKRALGSDLAKVDATTDEDIARQIAEDPDTAPEWTDEDFARAEVWHGNKFLGHGRDFKGGRRVGRPKGSGKKELVTLRLDREILDHFRAGGPGWQTRLNDELRATTVEPPRRTKRAITTAVKPTKKTASSRTVAGTVLSSGGRSRAAAPSGKAQRSRARA